MIFTLPCNENHSSSQSHANPASLPCTEQAATQQLLLFLLYATAGSTPCNDGLTTNATQSLPLHTFVGHSSQENTAAKLTF